MRYAAALIRTISDFRFAPDIRAFAQVDDGQEGHTDLIGCVFTGLSPEHVSRKGSRRRGGFEGAFLKGRIDQWVALRVVTYGSYREPEVSVIVLI